MRVIVKHTFVQVEFEEQGPRCRALTDTLVGYSVSRKLQEQDLSYDNSDKDAETASTTASISEVPQSETTARNGQSDSDSTTAQPSNGPSDADSPVAQQSIRRADEPSDRQQASNRRSTRHEFQRAPGGDRCTLMLRNLPTALDADRLVLLLDREGFARCFDFVYMPMDFQRQSPIGYVFVNFLSPFLARQAQQHFDGFMNWSVPASDDCKCEALWSSAQQGCEANVTRYRNSPVMHDSVPDLYKPRLYSQGRRVAFPAPTEKIRAPKLRRPRQ